MEFFKICVTGNNKTFLIFVSPQYYHVHYIFIFFSALYYINYELITEIIIYYRYIDQKKIKNRLILCYKTIRWIRQISFIRLQMGITKYNKCKTSFQITKLRIVQGSRQMSRRCILPKMLWQLWRGWTSQQKLSELANLGIHYCFC